MSETASASERLGRHKGGVEILSVASSLPDKVLSNADLEQMMETSDEWIHQRTGVKTRRIADAEKFESTSSMGANAAAKAIERAGVAFQDIDLVILATCTPEMQCPSSSCRMMGMLSDRFGASNAGAFDLVAACSGFVYGLNVAHDLILGGSYKTILVVGSEHLTSTQEYTTRGRGTAIIFGDGAGAAVLRATDDPNKGILAQRMHSEGRQWVDLYIPRVEKRDFPNHERALGDDLPLDVMRMNGRGVFKFAVSTFSKVIEQTLDHADVDPNEVDHYVCHQSNVRILDAARERFGLPEEKVAVNISRVGNTSAASIPILFSELNDGGRVKPGQKVMFVAFGGGLTWASSLWQI
ncbi:MAG: beta-ketoacyl-ACP synthase III [Planctomycetota bacterium]